MIDRTHLTYPSNERLKARLDQARKERLLITGVQGEDNQWTVYVTPSQAGEPYIVTIRWFPELNRAYTHCDCQAGQHGTPCKHAAMMLDELRLIGMTAHRFLDSEEFEHYSETGQLPEWEEHDSPHA